MGVVRKFLSKSLLLFQCRQSYSVQNKCLSYLVFKQNKQEFTNKMGCSTSKFQVKQKATCSSKTPNEEEYVEDVVCLTTDLNENEPKVFDLNEGKVLLIKQNGKINALGPKCTHYGAPLVSGALGDGRVRCQWHGACFNIETGDIEDFPGLDSLPCHKVTIEDQNVKVRAKKSELVSNKRVKNMVTKCANEGQSIIVIGGGPAGAIAVETLRQEGYQGKITFICKENCLPYDRVKVSKAMDFQIEKAQLRDAQFYQENGIEVLMGVEATAVESCTNKVTLSNGNELHYDRLFIATGSKPRKIPIPGHDLNNVIVLRNYEDCHKTNALLSEDKEVVLLGSSFIAMEAANYCVGKVKSVSVVARDSHPFGPVLGPRVGAAFRKLFEEKGVKFIPQSGITKCNGDSSNNITSVELADGTTLKADLLIMGTGSTFNTEFLKNSGIQMREDGSIETDEFLQTNVQNIFVGGDIAYAPVYPNLDHKSPIGHWALAHYHGKAAALNMLNKKKKIHCVPYFWTMLFGRGIRYAGHGSFDEIIYHGDVEGYKFVAFYLKNDEVVSMASCGMDPVVSQFAELVTQGKKLTKSDVTAEDPIAWTKRLV